MPAPPASIARAHQGNVEQNAWPLASGDCAFSGLFHPVTADATFSSVSPGNAQQAATTAITHSQFLPLWSLTDRHREYHDTMSIGNIIHLASDHDDCAISRASVCAAGIALAAASVVSLPVRQ